MRKIDLEERKQIQMEILDSIDKFCTEHNITYSLACGSLLGAVRHGGYIPWDDDIDIYMLRSDYIKFVHLFPPLYQNRYRLNCLERRNDWLTTFAKIDDVRTFIKEYDLKNVDLGINIDIFPIDDVPDEQFNNWNSKRKKKIKKQARFSSKPSKNRSLATNIGIILSKIIYLFYNRKKELKDINNFIQQHNNLGYTQVFETSLGLNCKRSFNKAIFNEIIEIKFENRKYKAFKNYTHYLEMTFGSNYMIPPPENKRKSYHTYDSFWK